jgi:riboflavin synthase alpha subunit
MFTGIIEEVGKVRRSEPGVLVVECQLVLEAPAGDSI